VRNGIIGIVWFLKKEKFMGTNESEADIHSVKKEKNLFSVLILILATLFAGISSNDLYLNKAGENKRSLKFFLIGVWGFIATILLAQGFLVLEIIPITTISKFFGINASSPITLIAIPFALIMLRMFLHWILAFSYSLKGIKKSPEITEKEKEITARESTSTPAGKAVASFFRLGFSGILWFACALFVVGILTPLVLTQRVGIFASAQEFEVVAINIFLGFIIGVKVILALFLEILKKNIPRVSEKNKN
jgi:hypothetical protein